MIYVISLQQMAVNKAHQSQSKAIEQRTMLCVSGERPGTHQHLSELRSGSLASGFVLHHNKEQISCEKHTQMSAESPQFVSVCPSNTASIVFKLFLFQQQFSLKVVYQPTLIFSIWPDIIRSLLILSVMCLLDSVIDLRVDTRL